MESYKIIASILFIIIIVLFFWAIYMFFSEKKILKKKEEEKKPLCNIKIVEDKPKKRKKSFFRKNKNEVFNISNNIFTYHDAEAVCKSYGADLANIKQIKNAYKKGAEWCSYGWSKDQLALYPTQPDTYQKLQKGDPSHKNDCGRPGVNGGYFQNPDLKFGVNCYGKKPKPKKNEKNIIGKCQFSFPNERERELYNKIRKFKSEKNDFIVMPFNGKRWNN